MEETTRLTVAGHRIRFIEPRRQLALEAGVAWMHGSPSILDGPIQHSIELIQSLLHQANRTRTRTGWNMAALRQLQTEVNALVWRNDDFRRPNSNNAYQDAAVVALQAGYTIEGRNPPNRFGSQPATTIFSSTLGHPGRTIVWNPSNVSFPGEETAGTIGCYLCGEGHFTSEHQIHRRPGRQDSSPPPSYPAATSTAPATVYESIPERPTNATASTSTSTSREPPTHVHPFNQRTRQPPTTPVTRRNNRSRTSPTSPTRGRSLQQRFTEGSRRQRPQRRTSNEDEFMFDSDAKHNVNT